MKENLLKKLICPACASEELNVECKQKNDTEIREGSICCQKCREVFPINAGITNLLYRIPQDVECEKKAMNEKVYYVTSDKKEGFTVTEDAIQKYQQILLSLPEGDGSPIFCCGGSLQNQAENASRFYKSVDELNLTGNEDILEVGASFGWGSREFAKKGCNVVALDITDFLCTSDLYFKQQSIYFDRILGDMNKLPFKTASFDIVFANTVLHHCMDLETIYRELLRVLKKGGKIVALGECSLGVFEDRNNKAFLPGKEEGRQEKAFRLYEWLHMAKRAGAQKVCLSFFSNIDDYIDKKIKRGKANSKKVIIAQFIKKHHFLEILFHYLTYTYRWLFRPGNWKIECYK